MYENDIPIGLNIKQQIDENNKIIQDLFNPNAYILNNTIAQLLKENEQLQSQCPHFFENGYCKFCYKAQEEDTEEEI